MRIAIVTAADSKYLPAACCTLLSCAWNGEAGSEASFFLLANDVSTGDVEKARSFLRSRGVDVEIIVIGASSLRSFRIYDYVTAATYCKLLLPQFFDGHWDRLLYVDADTRILERLQPLLGVDLRGKPLGAVHDYLQYIAYGIDDARKRLGLATDAPYFNAGVICFDWSVAVASGLLRRAQIFAIKSAGISVPHDQDALNKAFEGAWTPLDPRWNFMTVATPKNVLRLNYPERLLPYIAHFAGPVKPWMAGFSGRYEHHCAWYRRTLRDSPWPHFVAAPSPESLVGSFTSLAGRLKTLSLVRCGSLLTTLTRLLITKTRALSSPGVEFRANASKNLETNLELGHLLDAMVVEAAGGDTYRAGFASRS